MHTQASSRTLIALPRPRQPWLRGFAERPIRAAERAFGLDRITELGRLVEEGDREIPVLERAMQVCDLTVALEPREMALVPKTGPLLACANHPYGGADGLALLATLLRCRDDVKVLGNEMLTRFPFLADRFIFVDPFGGPDAARRNARGLREALEWMRAGHALACFPSGEVSAMRWGRWSAVDPPWSEIPARLALRVQARVLPVWFEGGNRGMFHAAGLVHPRLRTALLPSEFLARCGQHIEMRIGRAIETKALTLDAQELTRLARGRCEFLRTQPAPVAAMRRLGPVDPQRSAPEAIERELAALPEDRLLVSDGGYEVYAAQSPQIPLAMHEIGRLREIAFRSVGEGSGKASDTDRFDASYTQIIVWNPSHREIVGGYRAGVVREVTRGAGVDGLYTSTLFRYSPGIVEALADAVELGRSFVRVEYQRQPLPLSLLWRGIGVFMLRGGHRRMLGPVSISNDYHAVSKELIMGFLERHRLSTPLVGMIEPHHPPARRAIPSWTERERAHATAEFANLERLVEEVERGERGVPVMLRQYLRLNARLLAFNVDHDFGEVIDALMLVDLAQIDRRILRHYVGDEGVASLQARISAP